jgi:hypothetical protein
LTNSVFGIHCTSIGPLGKKRKRQGIRSKGNRSEKEEEAEEWEQGGRGRKPGLDDMVLTSSQSIEIE